MADKKSESLEDKTQLVIQKIQEIYKNNPGVQRHLTVFKALVSSLPIGAAFVYLIDEQIAANKNARVEQFMEDTANEIARLNERMDEQRIRTEHYAYIFEECIRGVTQYPQAEKIECYKAILINAALPSNIPDDTQTYFLNLINTLSPVHIRLIAALNRAGQIPQGGGTVSGQTLRGYLGNTDGDILMSAAAELYQLQFTRTEATSLPFNADLGSVGQRLSPIARKFVDFCTLAQ